MPLYKKSGQRTYWKITDKKVVRVLNQSWGSKLEFYDGNEIIWQDAMDAEKDITESEFMEQFKEARDRIMLEKL